MVKESNNLIVNSEPKSPISEAFRTLRTNIQFAAGVDNVKVVLITSPMTGDGKSLISSNLATAFAQQNKKVLLIDADMRKGRQHHIFGILSTTGLSNYLANYNFDKDKFINNTEVENLSVISSGPVPPNPSELLTSNRMEELMEELKSKFDFIILDGPPCLAITDGAILSRYADMTLLAVSHKVTRKEELKAAKEAIEAVGSKVSGVVLNKIDLKKSKYAYYKHYGYYMVPKEK